jgi:hypothetical protein
MEYDLPVLRNTYDDNSAEEENNEEKTTIMQHQPSVETWIWWKLKWNAREWTLSKI